MTIRAGVAVRDVTPEPGAPMSGFVARTRGALEAHDPLSVRALVVGDTTLVTVDVVGLHEDTCRRIRERCGTLRAVVVHATHTHGGPVSMPGRLGERLDSAWLARVEDAAVDAVHEAAARQQPVEITAANAPEPGVARNRRRPDGPVDASLPVVALRRLDGSLLAVVVSYACHPVILGADNLLLTADYPGVVRQHIEGELGGVALFLTGCAGDANTGHSAESSITTAPTAGRTFEACAEVGSRIARAALNGLSRGRSAPDDTITAGRADVELALDVPTSEQLRAEATRWADAAQSAPDDAQRALYDSWARWAGAAASGATSGEGLSSTATTAWSGSVSLLGWGPATIVGLPGEPFAATAADVRTLVGDGVTIVAGYCDGCPGYLPPADEYPLGGYEVADAHRYYGMPGPFAPGSAERLVTAVERLLAEHRG